MPRTKKQSNFPETPSNVIRFQPRNDSVLIPFTAKQAKLNRDGWIGTLTASGLESVGIKDGDTMVVLKRFQPGEIRPTDICIVDFGDGPTPRHVELSNGNVFLYQIGEAGHDIFEPDEVEITGIVVSVLRELRAA